MSAHLPKPTVPDACGLLLDGCRQFTDRVVDLSTQAVLKPEDRDEVLQKIQGLADELRELRKRYLAALPPDQA